jgi:glycosyltransferase involved in cell wall biosynthesis
MQLGEDTAPMSSSTSAEAGRVARPLVTVFIRFYNCGVSERASRERAHAGMKSHPRMAKMNVKVLPLWLVTSRNRLRQLFRLCARGRRIGERRLPIRDCSILYVTSHRFNEQPVNGARLRVLNIARLLARLGKVSVVIAADDYDYIDLESLEKTRNEFGSVRVVRVQKDSLRGWRARLRYELDPKFLITHCETVSNSDKQNMLAAIRESDVVWIHTIRTANLFGIHRWPHSVLDVDDVPSQFYASKAGIDASATRRLFDRRMSLIWRRRERLLQDRFTAITVCSENDRRYMGNVSKIHVVPNGFATPPQPPHRSPIVPARLGFIGLFDYEPNREGIEWFIKNVWPQIKRNSPATRLRLIGSGSDRDMARMGQDIDGLGYVDDPTAEIASWAAMIIPIRMGGGTRIKVLDAFSRMCPVVSTTLGAFGYAVRQENELLLADSVEGFGAACLRLIDDPQLGQRLSENAWKRFLSEWTWLGQAGGVEKAVQQCLGAK